MKPVVKPPNKVGAALARLRRDILVGRYKPGTRLPPERELAQKLGTNRSSLREALRILEAEHLVHARQGDGTTVLDWRRTGEIQLLPPFLAEGTPAEERAAAVATLLRLRQHLLDEALDRASERALPEEIAAITDAIGALRRAALADVVAADIEIYRRVAIAAHDLVVMWTFNTFAKIFGELGLHFPELWRRDDEYLAGLVRMTDALRARRPDRARTILADLLRMPFAYEPVYR